MYIIELQVPIYGALTTNGTPEFLSYRNGCNPQEMCKDKYASYLKARSHVKNWWLGLQQAFLYSHPFIMILHNRNYLHYFHSTNSACFRCFRKQLFSLTASHNHSDNFKSVMASCLLPFIVVFFSSCSERSEFRVIFSAPSAFLK
jgi:hypothetical protein